MGGAQTTPRGSASPDVKDLRLGLELGPHECRTRGGIDASTAMKHLARSVMGFASAQPILRATGQVETPAVADSDLARQFLDLRKLQGRMPRPGQDRTAR